MTTIYLLRHGAMAGDSVNRFVGQIDMPLSPAGVEQAQALAEALLPCPIGMVHCSDLRRSRQTAAIIADMLGVPAVAHRELREVSLGEWDGQPRHEVSERWAEQFAARGRNIEHFRPPGGESFADCLARALPAWNAIAAGGAGAVAVVGHAGVNRVLLCRLLGMAPADLFRLGQDYGCVNVIESEGDAVRVRLINGDTTAFGRRPLKNCHETTQP